MDNWMAPRAFGGGGGGGAAAAGGNGKLAKQGKAAPAQAAAAAPSGGGGAGESCEEGGGEAAGAGAAAAMGLLKRKRTSPPESPAPSKKRTSEEPELPKSSSTSEAPEGAATPGKQQQPQSGNSHPSSGDGRVSSKQLVGGQETEPVKGVLPPEEAVDRSSFEKDVDDLQSRVPASVENVSHGQGTTFQARPPPPDTATSPAVGLTVECEARTPVVPHRIPSHAGWFQWAKIHPLERLALPEFFSGKNSQKTPETYMEHRNCIITKYRENPQTLLKLEDVQGSLTGDVSGAGRLFGFLDHWGVINYQAISDFSPFIPSRGTLGNVEETNGALQFSPLVKPALANLFQFEAAMAPVPKLLSPGPGPASNLPLSSLAEAAVQESLSAPNVEYHCNSCQADCSKRRYHCQKQADFDLCADCYSDGKFGQGMTGTDFLRMDALTETADANGGGWSDQETLLLLEALELYGDNWTEIAEHVATKSKAQCILHFVRLPIEDPFLEDMEAPKAVITVPQPSTDVSDTKSTAPSNDNDAQAKTPQNEDPPTSEATEASLSTHEQDTSVPSQKDNKDTPSVPPTESNAATPKPEEREESDASKESTKVEESSAKHPLLTVAESAGCAGPNGLIAFADAGNPVMTQVAFLAAMVGPRVAAAAAQAALKSLAEDDPVGFLSAKNSFTLDTADNKDGNLVSNGPERLTTGHQSTENQSVASAGGPTVSSDNKAALTTKEDAVKEDTLEKGTPEKPSGGEDGAEMSQKPELNVPTSAVVAEQDVPSIAKVRNAAASALASAAVKAKLLADQEEREIQRLVAGVIENQLKKLELKLKHFTELESMLGKECEQAEKARAKVNAERARIVASRLGSTPSASQMQPMGSSSAPYTKASSVPSSSGTQPRPAVFTFGPTGVSAPAPVYKAPSGPEPSSSSMVAPASSQQGLAPQRLPRPPIPGTSLAPGVK